jgi:drug/metabolite transporter (DMT)-like permease
MPYSVEHAAARPVQGWRFHVSGIDLSLLAVVVIWGVQYSVIKQAISQMSPMVFASIRFGLASLFITAVLKTAGESLAFDRADLGRFVLLGFVGITVCQTAFVQGLARTTASTSALLLATSPMFVSLLSGVLGLEYITPLIAAGVTLSFGGTALIVGLGTGGLSLTGPAFIGSVICLCGAFSWASYSIMARTLLRRYSPLKVTTLALLTGTPLLILFSASDLLNQNWADISSQGWVGLCYSFLLGTVVAFAVWNVSIQKSGTTRTAVFSNLTPIIAVIVSGLFFGETLNVWQIVGAAITLTGVTLTRLAPRKPVRN